MDFNHWKGYTAQREGDTVGLEFLVCVPEPQKTVLKQCNLSDTVEYNTPIIHKQGFSSYGLTLRPLIVQSCSLPVLSTVCASPLHRCSALVKIHTDASN